MDLTSSSNRWLALSIFIKILPHFIFNAKLHRRLYLQPPLFHIKTKTILSDYSDQPKSFFGEYEPAHYENLYLIKNYSDYKRDNKFSDFHSGGSLQQRQDFNLIGSSIFFLLISPVWQWTIYKEYWYIEYFVWTCVMFDLEQDRVKESNRDIVR